jgi:adenosylmethionine-8-amino-7-oxononanoate aminotransferase
MATSNNPLDLLNLSGLKKLEKKIEATEPKNIAAFAAEPPSPTLGDGWEPGSI